MENKKRVVVIGLDGATPDLLFNWAKKGELSIIKNLMDEGSYGTLISTILPITAPAWTSFITGKNPGKHGIFDFTMRKKNSYELVPVTSKNIKSKTIFDILSEYGKKCIVVALPASYPPKKINGIMITGFPTLEEKRDYTYPSSILEEIESVVGEYKVQPKSIFSKGNEKKFFDELVEIVNKTADITIYLMKKYDWDLLVTVFYPTDAVSHWFWRHMSEKNSPYKNAILEIYKLVDQRIGDILKETDENTYIIVMSDHGMGKITRSFYPNVWLLNERYIKLKNSIITKIKYLLFKAGFTLANIYRIMSYLKIAEIGKKSVSFGRGMNILKKIFLSIDDIDWDRTKVYSAGNYGQLFINLKGREPRGIVNKKEYNRLREEITKRLYEIRDPITGEKIIEKVYKREDVFNGEYLYKAPDLIFLTKNMDYVVARFFEFGSNSLVGSPHRFMSGDHRLEGIWIMKGPHIKNINMKANIVDITPTILYLLGIPILNDMDGKVLTDVFDNLFVADNPPKYMKVEDRKKYITQKIRKKRRILNK